MMITGLHPSDSTSYSSMKESNVNMNPLLSATPWRHPHAHPSVHSHPHHVYSNPYVYDAAAAVALVGYSPYASSYSPHMDLAGRRKNATRETTATLKAWLYEHRKNPYPTKSEKVYLAIMTKMTLTQVSTWFANARRRLKKENKMTWSPRNRTNDDDDDRQGVESTSDASDDEDQSQSPSLVTPKSSNHNSSSSTTNNTNTSTSSTTVISNLSYLSTPLTVLQHHHHPHLQPNLSIRDDLSRKRKFAEVDCSSANLVGCEKKKSSTIWSLADMAEKNETKKIISSNGQFHVTKQRLSSSSSSTSTTSIHEKRNETKNDSSLVPPPSSSSSSSSCSSSSPSIAMTGAFKPLK